MWSERTFNRRAKFAAVSAGYFSLLEILVELSNHGCQVIEAELAGPSSGFGRVRWDVLDLDVQSSRCIAKEQVVPTFFACAWDRSS